MGEHRVGPLSERIALRVWAELQALAGELESAGVDIDDLPAVTVRALDELLAAKGDSLFALDESIT